MTPRDRVLRRYALRPDCDSKSWEVERFRDICVEDLRHMAATRDQERTRPKPSPEARREAPALPQLPRLMSPPIDDDAERMVVGSILLHPEAYDDVSDLLTPEMFHDMTAADVFESLKSLIEKGKGVDSMTVYDHMEKRRLVSDATIGWISDALASVPHAGHARYYAERVREFHCRRRFLVSACDAVAVASDPGSDIDSSLMRTEGDIHQLVEMRTGATMTSLSVKDLLLEFIDAAKSGEDPRTPTGYEDLDRLISGVSPNSLVILAARPSVGKTSFAGNLCVNIAKAGAPVLFVSLEQSRLEIAARLLAATSRVAGVTLKNVHTVEDMDRLMEASQRLSELPITVDDTATRTVSQIASICRLYVRRQGVKVVFIDYLQLITPEDRRVPREQQVADITRSLKLLAKSLGITIVALAQLSRAIEARGQNAKERRPRLSDLRESGSIEQDADQVWFLDRPVTYDVEADPSHAILYVSKHRNGSTGDIQLHWDGKLMLFGDRAEHGPPGLNGFGTQGF